MFLIRQKCTLKINYKTMTEVLNILDFQFVKIIENIKK